MTNMVKRAFKEELEWAGEIFSHRCLAEEWEDPKAQKRGNQYNTLSNALLKKFIRVKMQKLL